MQCKGEKEMSIEVRIPKEIKEYKEKIIFGLSLRQLVSVLIGGIVCLSTYFLLKPICGSNIASDIIILEAMPIFAFGFIKVRNLNFEEFIKIFLKHKLKKNIRIYETKLTLEYLKGGQSEDRKGVDKVDFNKTREEIQYTRTRRR